MLQPTRSLEALAPLKFLHGACEEAGIDVSTYWGVAMRETTALSQGVARTIMDMLKAGRRDFPVANVTDPTGNIEVPTRMVPMRFDEITRRNLLDDRHVLDDRQRVPHIGHEAQVFIIRPDNVHPGMYRKLGDMTLSTHPNFVTVDDISLSRPLDGDSVVRPEGVGFVDNLEAIAFLTHTRNYLDTIQ